MQDLSGHWQRTGARSWIFAPQSPAQRDYASSGYNYIQYRLRKIFGPVIENRCTRCDRPAKHWSLDNTAPDIRVCPAGRYSIDPMDYQPMCGNCNRLADMEWRRHVANRSYASIGSE